MEEWFIVAALNENQKCVLLRDHVPNEIRQRYDDEQLKQCIKRFVQIAGYQPTPWIILNSERSKNFNKLWADADVIFDIYHLNHFHNAWQAATGES